jgi:FkbM family methyltransferase
MVGSPLMLGSASLDESTVAELLRSGVGTVVQDVSLVTLDEEIAQGNLPSPNFVKIDIEGWEIEALRGASNTLKAHKPALFLEMRGRLCERKGAKWRKLLDFYGT